MKLLKVDTLESAENKLAEYFTGITKKTETVNIEDSIGRYLAEEVEADCHMPQFRRSVVDGYAVRGADTFGASESIPVFLDIVGSVDMGKSCEIKIKSGQAVYVPTGGMLPENADAVVMIEYTESLDEKTIAVNKPGNPGSGFADIGDDYKKGQKFFFRGHKIGKKDIGVLAALGKAELLVFQKPKITILSTGDEIIPIHQEPKLGEVRDINSYGVYAIAEETGVETIKSTDFERVKDSKISLQESLQKLLRQSDIVILSGGSSAGNKDMTAEIIDGMGEPGVLVHGLAMKPGKPTIIGVVDGKAMFGLPGHPVAAIMVFRAVVVPFIKKYYFENEKPELTIPAIITENIHGGEGRETFQMVKLIQDDGKLTAQPIHAKSGMISQMSLADGYIRIPAMSEGINAGQMAQVTLL